MEFDFAYRPGEGLPVAAQHRAREAGPVVWSPSLGGWVVSSYEAVKAVLGDPGRFTSEGTPVQEAFGREAMLVTDTGLHHTMRQVWAKHVTPAAMAKRAEALEAIAAASLAPTEARLAGGGTVDLVESFQDFVTRVIAWMFEVPADCIPDLKRWNTMFADAPALAADPDSPHRRAKTEVYAFLETVMQDRRDRMAEGEALTDLIGLMVAAEGQGGITRAMALDNLLNFFLGALDTTMKWLGSIVVFLDARPALRAEVQATPERLPAVMEEIMRLETVAQSLMRVVRRDTELAGVALKARDPVFVLLGAANRDPAVFDDPDAFRLDRTAEVHLGFGLGLHHCLGVATARQESRSFLKVLFERLPGLAVTHVDYGDTWAVWGPRRLEVGLSET
jgi:cytochrome P450